MSARAGAPLHGVTVLETASSPAVRFCGWMFAANGADVRVVRSQPVDDALAEAYLDVGKRVYTGDDPVADAASADVVLTDPDPHAPASAPDALRGVVDAFGPHGPYATWAGPEIVLASLGGASLYTLARDGTPSYGYGDRYQYLAGVYLYIGLVAGLDRRRGDDAAPAEIRVSAFESVVSLLPYLTTQYEYNGSTSTLEQSGPRYTCRCRDGFVAIYAGQVWTDLTALLGREDLREDPRFVALAARFGHSDELRALFDEWAAGRTVTEACAQGTTHGVAVTTIRSPAAMLAEPALTARDGWRSAAPADAGPGRTPALPYTVDGRRADRGAPR